MMARRPPTDTNDNVARDMLRGFVGEIERSDDRIASENAHKSEIFKAAKKAGFNVKALRKVIAARRMDEVDRNKLEGDFDLYWITVSDLAHAHVENIEEFPADEVDHDPETGEIIESNTAVSPVAAAKAGEQTPSPQGSPADQFPSIGAVSPEPPSLTEAGTDANGGGEHDESVSANQLNLEPDADMRNSAGVAAILIDKDGKERADAQALGSAVESGAPNSETREGSRGETPGTPVAAEAGEAFATVSPVVARPDGCLNPDVCASSSWRKLCHSCAKANLVPVGLTIGAADIPHEGSVH